MSTKKWVGVLLISGFASALTMDCFAEQHSKTPFDEYHTKRDSIQTPKRTQHTIIPTKRLTHIFENLYYHPDISLKNNPEDQWQETKEKLRSLAAVHFTDSIQIGFDRVKTGTSKYVKSEIVDVNSHLAPKSSALTSRGFGLQMKVELD